MKLTEGDLSAATNEIERFYALGNAARNALKEGKVKEAKALATELARVTPKYRDNWNYGNAVANANQVLGQIALSKGDIALGECDLPKHLIGIRNGVAIIPVIPVFWSHTRQFSGEGFGFFDFSFFQRIPCGVSQGIEPFDLIGGGTQIPFRQLHAARVFLRRVTECAPCGCQQPDEHEQGK